MQTSPAKKNERHENLCEELLREKAAVLSRAGMAVDYTISKLMLIDRDIIEKIAFLKAFNRNIYTPEILQKKKLIREQINLCIDQFNDICRKAQLQYYYLIVTREALGLRRHEMIEETYRIPAKKKKIQAF